MSTVVKPTKRAEKVAPFKKALSLTMRAISEDNELAVTFGVDRASVSGQKARLPDPSFISKTEEITLIRGSADMLALTHALHNENMHSKLSPLSPDAKAVFNMAEQARIASVGAAQMKGMATNLNADFAQKLQKRGVRKPETTEDAPMDIALALLLREKIAGLAPPKKYAKNLELWRGYFDEKAGDLLDNIAENKDDQFEFAKDLYNLLRAFDMGKNLDDLEDNQQQDMDDDANTSPQMAAIVIGLPRIEPELSMSKVTIVSLNSVSFSCLKDNGKSGSATTRASLAASNMPSSKSNSQLLFCCAKSRRINLFARRDTAPCKWVIWPSKCSRNFASSNSSQIS